MQVKEKKKLLFKKGSIDDIIFNYVVRHPFLSSRRIWRNLDLELNGEPYNSVKHTLRRLKVKGLVTCNGQRYSIGQFVNIICKLKKNDKCKCKYVKRLC